MLFIDGMFQSEHEFENVSIAHIKVFDDGIKRWPSRQGDATMITLLIGLLASTAYAWWHRCQSAKNA